MSKWLYLFLLIAICFAGNAEAYVLDGSLADWGVTPFISWTPSSSTADYVVNDDHTNFPSYSERSDIEALYFDNDDQYIYIALVSSYYSRKTYAGDIAFDFDGDGVYEFGMEFKGVNKTYAVRHTNIQKNPVWIMPNNSQLAKKDIDAAGPAYMKKASTGSYYGKYQGKAEIWYQKFQTLEGDAKGDQCFGDTWILEARIDRFLFDYPLDGTIVSINHSLSCANDYIHLTGTINGSCSPNSVVPEPSSLLLCALGIFGFAAGRKRFTSKKA